MIINNLKVVPDTYRDKKMEDYENMSISEVQRLAKQGDKDALFEMAYRWTDDEEAPPQVWKAYWMGKAADKGNIDAIRIYAGMLTEMPFPVKNCKKALELYDKFAEECRKAGNYNGEAFAKIESGIILCEGLGLGNHRDHKKGVQLIGEAIKKKNELGKKIMFSQLLRLGELYAMGYAQEDEAPSKSDLEVAIEYLESAISQFDNNNDDPRMLEHAKQLKDAQKQHLLVWKQDSKEYNHRVAIERRKKLEQPTEVGRQIEYHLRKLQERFGYITSIN